MLQLAGKGSAFIPLPRTSSCILAKTCEDCTRANVFDRRESKENSYGSSSQFLEARLADVDETMQQLCGGWNICPLFNSDYIYIPS